MRLLLDVCGQFNSLLNKHQKIRVAELVFIMLIGGLLETLSVTIIMPFMEIILNPAKVMGMPVVSTICDALGIKSDRAFLVVLACIIAFMYIFKNAFLLWEYNLQYRFVFNNRFEFQNKLLHSILNRPYQYFLNASSADIIRVINNDAATSFDVLNHLLNFCTELIVTLMLVITIFVVSPIITICISVILLLLLVIIFRFVRPRQIRAGKTGQTADTEKNKWILQSIEGIKEIKAASKEEFFEKKFAYYGRIGNEAFRKGQLLTVSPRMFIEAICMATMFIVIALLLFFGEDFEVIVPTLTVVAMAALRILPSTNRIAFTMSNLSFCKPRLDVFVEQVKNIGIDNIKKAGEEANGSTGMINALQDSLEFQDVSFAYSQEAPKVLNVVSLRIEKGKSVGIVGGSGSGKTTAIDIILGLLVPQSGKVLIDGVDIRDDIKGWLDQVGYIPQTIFMLDGTIRENVIFGNDEDADSDDAVWRALKEASLYEFVKGLPEGLDTPIGERGVRISGGQRQRIGIARALYKNPSVLIFDEATSALDNETEASIMESIHGLHGQKTMIIIAHRLTTIEACDHIYRVENGKIVKER